jgi:acetoin utilization protein AcuB
MKVRQYMSRPVVTVAPDTEFHLAFDLMRSKGIHHLPVVKDNELVGIVAERDLLLAAANFGPTHVPVGEIMRGAPVCVSEIASLKAAARLLVVNHIGSLPVLNAADRLVGIITETDIFKIAAGMLHARPEPKKAAKRPARKAAKKSANARARKPAPRRPSAPARATRAR